jgi:dipeptidyl aminopeptidase/acylaminoacyl peptidase
MINTYLDNSASIESYSEIHFSDIDTKNIPEKVIGFMSSNAEKLSVFQMFYRSNEKKIHGFLIVPKNREQEKIPCIIYNRGGNNGRGTSVGEIQPRFLFQGVFSPTWVALHGYCVIMSNYSGSSLSEGQDEFGGSDIGDILQLKEILGELPFVDSDAIGMMGASRGGRRHINLLQGLTGSRLL